MQTTVATDDNIGALKQLEHRRVAPVSSCVRSLRKARQVEDRLACEPLFERSRAGQGNVKGPGQLQQSAGEAGFMQTGPHAV